MHVAHSRRRTETLHSATRLVLARWCEPTHQGCRLLFTKADRHILYKAGKAYCHVSQFHNTFVLNKYSDDAALENAVTVVAFCLTSG